MKQDGIQENKTPDLYLLDFSVTLYRSERLFEQQIENQWLLFAPDCMGSPVVVDDAIYRILQLFTGGAKASQVLAILQKNAAYDFDYITNVLSLLEEKGFIREKPSPLPYEIPVFRSGKDPEDLAVWLHITDNCNLSCPYCFVQNKSDTAMDGDMLERLAGTLARTARIHAIKYLHIRYAGGEPTLKVPLILKFNRLLEHELEGSGIEISSTIFSNGTILTNQLISFLKRPQTKISISIDGIGQDHDITRSFKHSGEGTWSSIQKNLATLREHGIKPYILSTITGSTSEGLTPLLQWANDTGMNICVSSAREYDNCSEEKEKIAADYQSLCTTMKHAFNTAFSALEDPTVTIHPEFSLQIEELNFSHPAFVPCEIGRSFLVIRSDGTMVSCPFLIDEEGVQPSEDLLDTCRRCFPFDSRERRYDSAREDCVYCLWFPVCGGGCVVMNQKVNGYPFTKSPLCDFYSYIIPRNLQFMARKHVQARSLQSHEGKHPVKPRGHLQDK